MSLLTSRALMSQCSILERSDITGCITPALQRYLTQRGVKKLMSCRSMNQPAQNSAAMVRLLMALIYS